MKNRVNTVASFSRFAARLRGLIRRTVAATNAFPFGPLALELFALQFSRNLCYRRFCEARRLSADTISHWAEIPAVPTAAFKEWELTSLPPEARTRVFHSSGTTGQRPSRHFHGAESLALYEASLLPWFQRHLLPEGPPDSGPMNFISLTPPASDAPHSSLVHMFQTVAREFGSNRSAFMGVCSEVGAWSLPADRTCAALGEAVAANQPVVLPGTAFSFVHLLDALAEMNLRFKLPPGSRALETGGYKGRSRVLPKAELHDRITRQLGIAPECIVSEYGMSELGSQAYDHIAGSTKNLKRKTKNSPRSFCFPPWARAQVVSPETGREVCEGETGLLRVFDLANVWSVLAIQTEDLAVRRGGGFELLGRAESAEPRGCSLMPIEPQHAAH